MLEFVTLARKARSPGGTMSGLVRSISNTIFGGPPKPPVIPKPPTIDEASKNQAEQDRLSRRKGVLSNIYAGNTNQAAPSIGGTQLLGQ